LREWKKKNESHEQVAVGERVQRSSEKQIREQLERRQRESEGRRG